ncbi:hypothetical protein O9992_25825 [Vibrio lentus]|nr:hypothetical protein [Vibrio lentus]
MSGGKEEQAQLAFSLGLIHDCGVSQIDEQLSLTSRFIPDASTIAERLPMRVPSSFYIPLPPGALPSYPLGWSARCQISIELEKGWLRLSCS